MASWSTPFQTRKARRSRRRTYRPSKCCGRNHDAAPTRCTRRARRDPGPIAPRSCFQNPRHVDLKTEDCLDRRRREARRRSRDLRGRSGRQGRSQAHDVQETEHDFPQKKLLSYLRKREHIQHASFRRVIRQIAHRAHEPQRRRRITRIKSARHDRPGPATNARQYRYVLLPIRTAIRTGCPMIPEPHLNCHNTSHSSHRAL